MKIHPLFKSLRHAAAGILLLAAPPIATVATAADDARPVEDANKIRLIKKANPSLPTIYLIGDSTVRVGTPGMRGWGDELAAFFDMSKINIVNDAIGGRSSRTFITEGRWAAVIPQLQNGDFVIMQFGHNDGGPVNDNSRARGSLRGIGEDTQEIDNMLTHQHEVVHSYGWYMRQYVKDAKSHGATPIVCSPIPHNAWQGTTVARAAGSYGGWARAIAAQESALFVDLNEIIAEGYEKMGQAAVAPLFADGRTHTTPAGAQFNARSVVAGLRGLPGAPLDQYLSAAGRDVQPFAGKP
jgi:lysophospholipase L1-like esterase